ncbi:MAG: hypothetical protein HKO77_03730 [Gemmatimonadetes bacterium]|nr:hypothetical protein [Gemmatimonadota bacterium]
MYRLPVLLTFLLLAACAGDSPLAPGGEELAPSLTIAGQSGCYVVRGTISETGLFPAFGGVVSGDLEGTSATTVGFAGITGKVIRNPGVRTIEVTGGTVPELVGVTLEQSLEGISINTGAGPVRINERTTLESGAARGTFTTHGWLDTSVVPWEIDLAYRGVICL